MNASRKGFKYSRPLPQLMCISCNFIHVNRAAALIMPEIIKQNIKQFYHIKSSRKFKENLIYYLAFFAAYLVHVSLSFYFWLLQHWYINFVWGGCSNIHRCSQMLEYIHLCHFKKIQFYRSEIKVNGDFSR